jgi:Uma2 family endonuclease
MSRLTGLSTTEFDRLVAAGEIREGSRSYLWAGEVCTLMPENQPHVNAVENLRDLLVARLDRTLWTVNQGHPVELSDGYKPQPDLTVLRGARARYRRRTPEAADVALLVEVADSTYPEDAGEFLQRYAIEGIAQYWIVNIPGRRVELYQSPDCTAGEYGPPSYADLDSWVPLVLTIQDNEPAVFPEIAVADILRDSLGDA